MAYLGSVLRCPKVGMWAPAVEITTEPEAGLPALQTSPKRARFQTPEKEKQLSLKE